MKLLVVTGGRSQFMEFLRVSKANPLAATEVVEARQLFGLKEVGTVVFYGDADRNPAYGVALWLVEQGKLNQMKLAA